MPKSNPRWALWSIFLAAFMTSLDGSIVNISLPTISRYYHASSTDASWIVLAYILAVSSTMLFWGRVSDSWGLKAVFVIGFFGFTLGSLFCALAPSIGMLIAGRAFQGLSAAMLVVSAFALIPRLCTGDQSGLAFGTLSSVSALGLMLGAPIGGFLSDMFSWHWIFLINIPLGTLAVILSSQTIPKDERHSQLHLKSFDIPGAILSVAAPLVLIGALNQGGRFGMLGGIASVGLVVALIVWEKRSTHPLMDLSLFANRSFILGTGAIFFAISFLAGLNFIIPFFLELVLGLSSSHSGLVVLAYSLPLMLVAPIAGKYSARIGPRPLATTGMILVFCSCLLFSVSLVSSGLILTLLCLLLFGCGFGLFNAPMNNYVMRLVPLEAQGHASGFFQTIVRTGMALGVAIFELVFSRGLPNFQLIHDVSGPHFAPAFRSPFYLGAIFAILAIGMMAMDRKKWIRERSDRPH